MFLEVVMGEVDHEMEVEKVVDEGTDMDVDKIADMVMKALWI